MSNNTAQKHKIFVTEYILDFNGTRAAIAAGYSAKSAPAAASRLLNNVNVQDMLAKAVESRNERTKINADYVLYRLQEIDQLDALDIISDSGGVRPMRDWPKAWRTTISGFDITEINSDQGIAGMMKKIKLPDKIKNLELLGKHVDIQAFKDKLEVSADTSAVERLQRGRDRSAE